MNNQTIKQFCPPTDIVFKPQTNITVRNTSLYLFLLFFPFYSIAQNCLNAGLEDGALTGYTTYYGKIDKKGRVTIDKPGTRASQHRIMHTSEGIDPIAEKFCAINDSLPVVPEGSGQYTLRLGNSHSGGNAERVILKFTVTPELTFFLLKYAVILNDPSHDPHEQPRFELRILDENGAVFPCGEYNVRAAADIPGFESCGGGWRVRPWTAVGFELQSFLGQTIQIELLTTDCAQGGHAGYAYLDASCQPLNIQLNGYCPGKTEASLQVTEGFINYQWNTGATGSTITVNDPQPGNIYEVTVTSATGCTMVLMDTIPNLTSLPAPTFSPEPDKTFCRDTAYWFVPAGEHLENIYSPTLGITSDAFLIGTENASTYTFVSSDRFGCNSDTLQFSLHKAPLKIQATLDSIDCIGDNKGSIELYVKSDFPPIQYNWDHGPTTASINQLEAGDYSVTITDDILCTSVATFALVAPPPLTLETMKMEPISCHGAADGALHIDPKGGTPPYTIDWNAAERNTTSMTQLSAGTYTVTITDAKGCAVQDKATLEEPPSLQITPQSIDVSCYGATDGAMEVHIDGGLPPYDIYWADDAQNIFLGRDQLAAGNYFITISDQLGCSKEAALEVREPPFNKDCGTYIPTAFSPNGDGINDHFYVAGSKRGVAIMSMQIFNRWGELVFDNQGQCPTIGATTCGWAGRYKGQPSPSGLYLYVVLLQIEGVIQPVLYKGEVMLLK